MMHSFPKALLLDVAALGTVQSAYEPLGTLHLETATTSEVSTCPSKPPPPVLTLGWDEVRVPARHNSHKEKGATVSP